MTHDTFYPYDRAAVLAGVRRNNAMMDAAAAEADRLRTEALEAYWRDPAAHEAKREAGQAQINALFAPHEGRIREMQEARWAREGEAA